MYLALISKRERENLGIVLTLRLKRQDNVYTLQNTNTTLMKKIEAIIRRTRFEDVKEALLAADIEWFSYYDVLT